MMTRKLTLDMLWHDYLNAPFDEKENRMRYMINLFGKVTVLYKKKDLLKDLQDEGKEQEYNKNLEILKKFE